MPPPPSTTYLSALLISVALAAHGLRKGSLSNSGAIAAFMVGYGHLANPLKVFGVGLIFFYLAGSRATKVSGACLKAFVWLDLWSGDMRADC